ncbi:MAG: OmpA family protein [Deltaproteobacteria bacterium]|nr:OmpA family protein [Deltaproteobacteria bacterium]
MAALATTFALGALAVSPSVHAQQEFDTDFVVEQFEPLPNQGANILNIGKSDVVKHLHPSFGVVVNFQDDPFQLVEKTDEDRIRQRIIDHVLKGEVWASIGFFEYVDIGFIMPLVLNQKAGTLITDPQGEVRFDDFTTADLRIVPKLRILNPVETGGFGLALLVPMSLPTGDSDSYNSEGSFRIEPRLVLDFQTEGGFVAAANVGFQPRANRKVMNFQNEDAIKWGLGVQIPLIEDRLELIGTLFGTVAVGADVDISAGRTAPIEALGGVQFWFDENWLANAGAGAGLTDGVGAPDVRLFLSVGYTPRKKTVLDTDGDGYPDDTDKCPLEPEDFDLYQDEDGCPEIDNDGDGVLDVDDGDKDTTGYGNCRNDPEDRDGFEDANGCPDPDNDRDGVLDVADGQVDASGFGACRDNPEDKDLFEDEDGCPDPDNDKDGILDIADGELDEIGFGKCRNDPESVNNYQDTDGCPDVPPVAQLTETSIAILDKVYFDFNKATIQERSFPLLDEVAKILRDNPQVDLVRVEGHTDIIGTRAYNMGLSDRRAKSVMKYLVDKGGVAKSRLIAKGYGYDFPIATCGLCKGNDTAMQEGRDLNRRVEFNILTIDGKPVENQVIRTKPK